MAQRDRPDNEHRGGRDWKVGLRKARSINSGSSACQTGTPVQRKRWKRDSVTCLCYLLFCWFGFSSFVGLVSRLNVAFFVFAAFIASGNLFLFADVVGWLVLLVAGLFCAPGCFVGGSLIDGLGLGWFGLAVCSLLDWWLGSALLA